MTATMPDAATTVRRLLQAFLAGDLDTFTSYTDDDIDWNPAEHNSVLTQQYRGREQYLNSAVATVAAELEGFQLDIETCAWVRRRSGHRAVLPRHRQSIGRPLSMPAAVVWEVRDGKVTRTRGYMDTCAVMNAYQEAN